MPVFEIQGPDGKTYELDAPDANTAMSAFQSIGAQPKSRMYKDDVNGAAGSAALGVMDGLSFGFADEIGAGINSAIDSGLHALTGREGKSYDEWLAKNRGLQESAKEEHPVLYTGGQLGGGIAGGVGLAKNGATLAGRVGEGILPRMAGYGAEGGAYGAAQGFGGGEGGFENRLGSAFDGAKVGAVIGAGLPLAGSAVSAAVRGGQTVAGPGIEGAGRTASALLRGAAQADEAGLRSLGQMGPDAMLVDAGPSMLGLGQGAGTGTGQGRTELVNALRERDAGTGQRLATVLNDQLGPAPIPSRIRAGIDESKAQIGDQYNPSFNEASSVDTRDLAGALDEIAVRTRGPAQAAVQRVRGYLNKVWEQGDPEGVQLDADPRTLFETRQAIDGLLAKEDNPKVIRQMTMARQSVDELLQHAVPRIKEVDGRFQEVARQDGALSRGAQVFDTGKTAIHPTELADEFQQGAIPEGMMIGPSAVPLRMRQGARAEVGRLVGTNVNDLNTLERKLGTGDDWNNAKFATVFGEGPRDAVMEALTTNRRFRQSYQDIVQNSQTAQRQAAQKSMDGEIEVPMDLTLTGTAAAGGRAIWRALMGLSKEATKDEIGKILAKKGPDAQRIMEALLTRNDQINRNTSIARALIANSGTASGAGQIGGQRANR